MGLSDYDFPDDYEDPLDQVDAYTRNRMLAAEEAAKNKWGFSKNILWVIGVILAYIWGSILSLLGIFCVITVILSPLAIILFPLAGWPLKLLIEARVRNRIACTIPTRRW